MSKKMHFLLHKCIFLSFLDLVILYAPYLPYYLSQVNQILQKKEYIMKWCNVRFSFDFIAKNVEKNAFFVT